MGLDTYASNREDRITLTGEQEEAFEDADISLCGGMYSGYGGSFRGKVYVDLLMDVTGVHLYQDWISPETVREMVAAFREFDAKGLEEMAEKHKLSAAVIRDLQKFLAVCAEHDLGLIGWW
jgi:hypothetical protein